MSSEPLPHARSASRSRLTALLAVLLLLAASVAVQAARAASGAPGGTADLERIAFVARNDVPFDALAIGPVAGALGGILVTTPSAAWSADAEAALTAFGPDVVYVAGGVGAIRAEVFTAIDEAGNWETRRVAGSGRDATAAAVAGLLADLGAGRPALVGGRTPAGGLTIGADLLVAGDGVVGGDLAVAGTYPSTPHSHPVPDHDHGDEAEGPAEEPGDAAGGGGAPNPIIARAWVDTSPATAVVVPSIGGGSELHVHEIGTLEIVAPTDGVLLVTGQAGYSVPADLIGATITMTAMIDDDGDGVVTVEDNVVALDEEPVEDTPATPETGVVSATASIPVLAGSHVVSLHLSRETADYDVIFQRLSVVWLPAG